MPGPWSEVVFFKLFRIIYAVLCYFNSFESFCVFFFVLILNTEWDRSTAQRTQELSSTSTPRMCCCALWFGPSMAFTQSPGSVRFALNPAPHFFIVCCFQLLKIPFPYPDLSTTAKFATPLKGHFPKGGYPNHFFKPYHAHLLPAPFEAFMALWPCGLDAAQLRFSIPSIILSD